MHTFLATPTPLDTNGAHSILIWSGVLIAFLLAAFGGYSVLKRWMTQEEVASRAVGFTLSDLKELRDQGKMSTEEYEQTRAKMVAAAKRMTEKLPEVTPRKPGTSTPARDSDPPISPS